MDMAQVVSKIIKHSRDSPAHHISSAAYGLLLGMDLDGTLEISNCFAMPHSSDEEERTGKAAGWWLFYSFVAS